MKMKIIKIFLPVTAILFFSSCGIWTDFTTYFNLYFNSKQLQQEALLEIDKLDHDPFALNEPEATGNLKSILTDLQTKTSKILQHSSESSYFDDALYLSGFAFYYSGNYLKASRKFQELASLQKEDYKLLSRLWIGKCELQMRNFETGIQIINRVRDSALVYEDEEILEETYRVMIAYHIDRQNFDQAIEEGHNLIEVSENDELRAKAAYKIGTLHLDAGNEEEAAQAFESVLDFSPGFEIEFQSKFELAKLKKELGDVEESREMFEDLYNEGKYSEFWGDVYFQIGLMEYESENYEKAFDIFEDVNELYSSSLGAIQSKLMLGEIMRTVYADYDSAKTYYDQVKSNNRDTETSELAEIYSQSIDSYVKFKTDIKQTERQMIYLDNPEQFLRDSVAYQNYLATLSEEQQTDQTTQQTTPGITQEPTDTTAISDTTETSPQDSLFAASTPAYDIEFDESYIVTEKPVYPTVGIDSLEARLAKHYFDLGNLFFTDLNRLDSAYYYYDMLLSEFPETPNQPRVLFTLGTYWESKGDSVKSDSLYAIVYNDYKTHPIANEAAEKLGKPPLITESDPAKDEFLIAEDAIEDSSFVNAVSTLKNIPQKYPESIYVPKSLYTIGWLYENKINQPDSAVGYYSQLLDDYANSEYASAVRAKVNTFQTEMEKILKEEEKTAAEAAEAQRQRAIADSLNALGISSEVQDSTMLPGQSGEIVDSLAADEATRDSLAFPEQSDEITDTLTTGNELNESDIPESIQTSEVMDSLSTPEIIDTSQNNNQ